MFSGLGGGSSNAATIIKYFYKKRKIIDNDINYFEKYLALVENILSKQDSLFGYNFGLADILLTTCLDWAEAYEFNLPLNVSRYHEAARNREAYKIAFDTNYKTKI